MAMRSLHSVRRPTLLALITMPWLLMAGCATQHVPAGNPPPPPLQLISAEPLAIPDDCAIHSGTIYRTSYLVQRDGRVADVAADPAPACLQRALTQWISAFQYAPPGEPVATVIDWMGVTGESLRH
jgi:hypothetical protein